VWVEDDGIHVEVISSDVWSLVDPALALRLRGLSRRKLDRLHGLLLRYSVRLGMRMGARLRDVNVAKELEYRGREIEPEIVFWDRPRRRNVGRLLIRQAVSQPYRWRLDALEALAFAVGELLIDAED
jgi:hypothetical protein